MSYQTEIYREYHLSTGRTSLPAGGGVNTEGGLGEESDCLQTDLIPPSTPRETRPHARIPSTRHSSHSLHLNTHALESLLRQHIRVYLHLGLVIVGFVQGNSQHLARVHHSLGGETFVVW